MGPATATLLGGGLSALGSLFGGRSAASEARRTRRMQMDQFNAMMDRSIQRRVADAKKAGIHPLAALGSSPGAGPTITGAGVGAEGRAIADAGEAVGRAVTGAALAKAQKENLESNTLLNASQAAYWESEAARLSANSPGTDGANLDTNAIDEFSGAVETVPAEVIAKKSPGVEAGKPGLWQERELRDGSTIRIMRGEGAEDMNVILVPPQIWWNTLKSLKRKGINFWKSLDANSYRDKKGNIVYRPKDRKSIDGLTRLINRYGLK